MKKAFITIVMTASMGSCGIYTQYQHPESIMPEGLYHDIEPYINYTWKAYYPGQCKKRIELLNKVY